MQLDVLVTHNILYMQCFYHAFQIHKLHASDHLLKAWSKSFFIFIGLSVLLEAIHVALPLATHAFIVKACWDLSLILLGVGIAVSWNIGASVLDTVLIKKVMLSFSLISFFIYYVSIIIVSDNFIIAIFYYTLAVLNLILVLIVSFNTSHNSKIMPGIIALFLILLGTCMQQMGSQIPAIGLSKNAAFDVFLIIAFAMIMITLKYFIVKPKTPLISPYTVYYI
jgi:hypothetical protein